MFLHVFEKEIFEELEKRGAIPLKKDSIPYVMLLEEDNKVSFSGLDSRKFEIADTMYF